MQTWKILQKNPALWDTFFLREQIIRSARKFFDDQEFHEVETPTLIGHPAAESYLEIFETTLLDRQRKGKKMYLATSPELYLKKLIVAGIGNCYSLTKSFRNTEMQSDLHNPEFTILEWYRVGANYMDIASDCERLLLSLCHIGHSGPIRPIISYQNYSIDLTPPWQHISVSDAFQTYANVDLNEFFDIKKARGVCKKKGYGVTSTTSWEKLYHQILLNEVEPSLPKDKPIILYDFPSEIAALAKKKDNDPRFAERFEFYIGGLELGDCYTELTNWKEQQDRFDHEMEIIQKEGHTSYIYDKDFIDALKTGLPPCSGIAVGIDRLVMLLTDKKTIQETLLFPIEELL